MRYKIFGRRTGLMVSELVLGAGLFGMARGFGTEPEEVKSILAAFTDAGGNFIDTADVYQHGVSEALLGENIASRRDDFILSSKYSRGPLCQRRMRQAFSRNLWCEGGE